MMCETLCYITAACWVDPHTCRLGSGHTYRDREITDSGQKISSLSLLFVTNIRFRKESMLIFNLLMKMVLRWKLYYNASHVEQRYKYMQKMRQYTLSNHVNQGALPSLILVHKILVSRNSLADFYQFFLCKFGRCEQDGNYFSC